MARWSYPRTAEPRPAALPPDRRTVGQLVAESVRFYGEHFRRALLLGIAPTAFLLLSAKISRTLTLILGPTLLGALLSATFVAACVLVLGRNPGVRRLGKAWIVGWLVFIPAPILLLAFVLPALAWLAAFGLVVPVLVVEELGVRASLSRAWQLARADYVHALGSLATLAIVAFLTQSMLAFVLRGTGGAAVWAAFALADAVISPLIFIGAAMLYLDQAARVE